MKNLATSAQKNDFCIVFTGKKDDSSSSEKRTPPMGAPNAVATPAAVAAEIISSFLPSLSLKRPNWSLIKLPMHAAM
jgi:hypothetical protein